MAIDIDDPGRLDKATVMGGDGRKLGTVAAVYYDNETGRPAWVAVRTGLFGRDVSVVPLAAAQLRGEELHVPFDKQRLRTAPHHNPDRELTPQDEIDLFAHYGMPYGGRSTGAATGTGTPAERVEPADEPGARTDPDAARPTGDHAMTRSEEQLRVRTESQPVERVRLRKHVVTHYEQITVPVRREEIRVEQVPVDGSDTGAGVASGSAVRSPDGAGVSGDAVSEPVGAGEEHEIVLYAERPVVRTERVPVERVRLGKRTVTEQQQVDGQVRREQIELDTDADVDPGEHESR
jgi:stress response protein YsnF